MATPRLICSLFLSALTAAAQATQAGAEPNLLSPRREAALGAELARQVWQNTIPVDNAGALSYVEQMGARFAAQLPEPRDNYTFAIIKDAGDSYQEPIGLPGGYMFIPDSLFLKAHDDSEFAGLLAHAMAHVAARQFTRIAARAQVGKMFTIPLIFYGDWTGFAASKVPPPMAPIYLGKLRQDLELEADALAVNMTSAVGYDPEGLIRYLARNAPESENRDARIAAMRSAIQNLPHTPSGDFLRIQEDLQSQRN